MSVNTISSFTSPSRFASLDPLGPAEPAAAASAPAQSREHRRRHELVDAMNRALGVGGNEQGRAQQQAVFRFAQTLMHDLRSMDAGAPSEGGQRPRIAGKREWNDLPQRLNALANAASRPMDAATTAAVKPVAKTEDVPDTPNPVTPATVAVHLMTVPSSHLLEAFVTLHRALGRQQDSSEHAARKGLAELAGKLAESVAPDASAQLPAGSVFHVTA